MTRKAIAGLVWVAGSVLACSGRFDVGVNDDVASLSASGSAGGGGTGQGANGLDLNLSGSAPGGTVGNMSGIGMSTNPGGSNVRDSACGVPLGLPEDVSMGATLPAVWWERLQRLIWTDVHDAPVDALTSLSYAEAGQIADAAIDQAIAETGGIPAAEAFVRHWVAIDDGYADQLTNDWSTLLSGAQPAPSLLLTAAYDDNRSGAFSDPAFLQVYPTISRRGYVMLESVFGLRVPPEPDGTPVFMPPAGLQRREGLEREVSDASCAACHHYFDPLGYALESFDELGEYRTMDAGRPVDASGTLQVSGSEEMLPFSGIADLGLKLHERCDVNLAFADRFLLYALELSDVPYASLEAHDLDRARVQQAFIRSGRSYRSLIKAFAQSSAINEIDVGAK